MLGYLPGQELAVVMQLQERGLAVVMQLLGQELAL